MSPVKNLTAPDAYKTTKNPTRGFWFLRDIPTLIWFFLIIVVSVTHRWLPMPTWLLLHLLFLGAASHAILVWSQYFTAALTRTPATENYRKHQNIRIVWANVGAVFILVGVPWGIWPLTLLGVVLLIAAIGWHAVSIWQRSKGALSGRFAKTTRYYLVSAASLVVGATLGAIIANPLIASANLKLAHELINVLGWIGITVAGTIITLWPTMLRTSASENSAIGGMRALPLLGLGVLIAGLGAIFAISWVIALGLAAYASGLIIIFWSILNETKKKAPRTFATLSAAAAFVWWIAALIFVMGAAVWASITGSGVLKIISAIDQAVPYLAAGFVAQIIVAALSYLIPVVSGGGPVAVRAGTATLDKFGNFRVALTNSALFVTLLPVSSITKVITSLLYLIAIGWVLPLIFAAVFKQLKVKREAKTTAPFVREPGTAPLKRGPVSPEGDYKPGQRAGGAIAGLIVTVVALAFGSGGNLLLTQPVTGSLFDSFQASQVTTPAGNNDEVIRVQVEAKDMKFFPDTIEVAPGTHLIIELTNTDASQVHDLVFENGVHGSRIAPGESETLDLGIINSGVAGWCSIIGHRQMGMTLDIVVTGETSAPAQTPNTAPDMSGSGMHHTANGVIDLMTPPAAGFKATPALLPPLDKSGANVTHKITLPVTDEMLQVAPGITQNLWTFGGSAPGPLIHGRVGDTFEVTLINDGSIGHSIDFHAGALAPNEPMRTIAPGETLTYTFTATKAGIWMYHCSTHPMTAHIANGMYGAVIIEPDDLPEVDRSYAFVQGEYYLGAEGGEVDFDKLAAEKPDLVTFNGYANQYVYDPLPAKTGERVRLWVLDAGPNRGSSFHVIGGQFDTVWFEGDYTINRATESGSQALGMFPAQGGFVELTFPEAGDYPFVSHIMIDAERGAKGLFHVE